MQPIQALINKESPRASIANLQDASLLLIKNARLPLPDDEWRNLLTDRETQVYRDGTARTTRGLPLSLMAEQTPQPRGAHTLTNSVQFSRVWRGPQQFTPIGHRQL
jgi:hypothetical protein